MDCTTVFTLCNLYLIYIPHISIFNFLTPYAAQIFYSVQPLFNLHTLHKYFKFSGSRVRNDGLNKRGVNCFIKDFRKYLLHNEFLTKNSYKHLRKAIKQSNKNRYQNFNRLRLRFNWLFIAAKYQTIREFEGKKDLHTRVILVHSIILLHPVLSQTTEYSIM